MSYNAQHSLSQTMSQQHSFPGQAGQKQTQNQNHNGAMQSPYKAFNDPPYGTSSNMGSSMGMRTDFEKPQIYTAVYSGVQVYEMEVNGIACMRRRSDGWLNATQILKVAGVDKGKRTKVLEKEILNGEHEKVQGGYGKYQGTWINYSRGRQFCRQYGVEDALLPLLEHDLDGSAGDQNNDTPTKEQAMAANRKRFYNAGLDPRNGSHVTSAAQSTFFQNISPMSSIALAAMNKAARLNSPVRPASNLRRPPSFASGTGAGTPQHRLPSAESFPEPQGDHAYASQNGTSWRPHAQEPPRKRLRSNEDAPLPVDASIMSLDATEPGDSFIYASQQFLPGQSDNDEPVTYPPLPAPSNPEQEDKKTLLLDLFADAGRVDYTSHPAFTELSPEDLSIPLDASANTALHWAATLSRITLLRLLIQKGANIKRGNVAGQSALISAVLVNNCWEHSSFPDVLELLSPLIEVRDAQGRTILHHIAVSCGIKGRAPSSKYYLEALLEFLVRSVRTQAAERTATATENSENQHQPAQAKQTTLMRFLTHIVNARDKLGNTALNLVARIGNRSIIQQLLEIKADPTIANYKGVSARDFGVGVEDGEASVMQHPHHAALNGASNLDPAFRESPERAEAVGGADGSPLDGQNENSASAAAAAAAAQAAVTEDQNQDVISSLTTMLTQNFAQHKSLLAAKAQQIDKLNAEIQDLSAVQKAEADELGALQKRVKLRSDRMAKVANLRRLVEERRRQKPLSHQLAQQQGKKLAVGEAEGMIPSLAAIFDTIARGLPADEADVVTSATDMAGLPRTLQALLSQTSTADLQALQQAYRHNNASLSQTSQQLQKQSSQLEQLYRKTVSLCTGVAEERVEESLPLLVAAVESERGGLGREEVGRVRSFLMKVEGVGGGADEQGARHVTPDGQGRDRRLMGPPELPA